MTDVSISSWNVWGMPFVSPNFISRTGALGSINASIFADAIRNNTEIRGKSPSQESIAISTESTPCLDTPSEPPHLIVMTFQEAWAFRAGLAYPLVWLTKVCERASRCMRRKETNSKPPFKPSVICTELFGKNSVMTIIASVVSVLQGWLLLPISKWPFLWDPKAEIASSLKKNVEIEGGLQHAIGTGGASMGRWYEVGRLLDSGLLIAINSPIVEGMFESYKDQSCEKSANKGFLWVVCRPPPVQSSSNKEHSGLVSKEVFIIATTHLNAAKQSARAANITQLTDTLNSIQKRYTKQVCRTRAVDGSLQGTADAPVDTTRCRIFVTGDFNISSNSEEYKSLERMCEALNLERVTDNIEIGTSANCHLDDRVERPTCDGSRAELDHIFTSKAFSPDSKIAHSTQRNTAGFRPFSDHAMVCATHVRECKNKKGE
eukprot:GHVN01038470.1.p1 GENE.GHVN01038470.1~~GHVN01038470.1.p1  ORF type:complete len:433 (+),score=57.36 GHVN01038470.1:28-1326(+)